MYEKLSESDIEFLEFYHDPVALLENIMPVNINAPSQWDEDAECVTVRPYQFAMLGYDYLYEEDDSKTKKQNMRIRKGAGDIFNISARNIGKCEFVENKCQLASGEIKTFGELLNSQQMVLSYNEKTMQLEPDVAHFTDNGSKKCYKVVLRSGKEITITENHPLLTNNGWKKADILEIDDLIATPRKYNNLGKIKVDENAAKLLGYLLGDGSCTGNIGITNIHPKIIKEIYELGNYFNCKVRKDDITYFYSNINRKFNSKGYLLPNPIQNIVKQYGLNDKLSKNKQIPKEVFQWDNKSIALLLNRLFACDGHYNLSSGHINFEITLASKDLIYDVQSLLLRFGIHSDIHYKSAKCKEKYFDSWRLNIGYDADKLIDLIGSITKTEQLKHNRSFSTSDIIPSNLIHDEIKENKKLKHIFRNKRRFGFSRLKTAKYKELENISNSNVFWDKIKEIKAVGLLPTVAVEVKKNHNYISNNIISHNTFLGLVGDALLALLHYDGIESCIASFDEKHLKEVSEKVCNFVECHKLFKMFNLTGGKKTVGRSPHRVHTRHGHLQIGVNEKVSGKNVGTDFHGKHYQRFLYDEACVDRNTLIRYVDKNNNQKTERISTFINSGRWKNNLVYSYNFKTEQIELKKVINIFKKTKKNYKYNSLFVQGFGNTKERHLIVSQNQNIMTSNGYKNVSELKDGETLYTSDYIKLTDIQKQIVVGTLLGDSNINLKRNNHNPSISFTHSIHQKLYLEYKRECFKNLFFSFHRQNKNQNIKFCKTSFGGNVGRLTSDTCVDLKDFIDFKKPSLNKKIIKEHFTAISLAFWLMDDGQLQGTKGKLNSNNKVIFNTCGFSKEDNLFLMEVVKEKLGINFEIELHKNKYYRLVAKGNDFKKIIEVCKNYIHPTMLYKIYSNYELCHFINDKFNFSFTDLSNDVKYLLQEVKLLRKTEELQSSWTMYDIEVEDNHNFFANGILISNSYMSEEGTDKRIDSGSSLGYIERLFGIPDLRVGSPLGSILSNPRNKKWICRLPQFVREDWDEHQQQKMADQYGGKSSMSYKLNVAGDLIEGAFGKYDMERLKKKCYNPHKKIKFFEVDKEIFKGLDKLKNENKLEELSERLSKKIIIDRLPCTQIIVASDIGTSGSPSEITIHFHDATGKWKYEYQISLFKLIPKEQAMVFNWIYDKLGSCFISLDCTNMDGATIRQMLIDDYKIPADLMPEYKMNQNIEVDFERDPKTGKIKKSRNNQPIMVIKNTKEWAIKCLEEIFYNGLEEIPHDEKFLREFSAFFERYTGNRPSWGSTTTDHLHDSFLFFALCRWENANKVNQNVKPKKRALGVI